MQTLIEFLSGHPWLLVIGIFCLRICDQSIGTLRTIAVVRGYAVLAVFMGFFEVFIWINVVGQVIQNLHAWYLTVSYAAGFAAGQAVGMWVEARLALGNQLVRVISNRDRELAHELWKHGYPATETESMGPSGPVDVIFIVAGRENIPALVNLVCELDPDCFYTVEDVRKVSERHIKPASLLDFFPWLRVVNVMKKR
jgi:uncharacterized protein YebE (UPF0316 family)